MYMEAKQGIGPDQSAQADLNLNFLQRVNFLHVKGPNFPRDPSGCETK